MSDTTELTLRKAVLVSFDVEAIDVLRSLSDAQLQAECALRCLLPREVDHLTGDLVRGARGLLNWTMADLASASGVSASTIKRFEDGGPGRPQARKVGAICRALQHAGIRITSAPGALAIHRAVQPHPRPN